MSSCEKRSWLRVSLRTLMLLTLAAGCGLGLVGRERDRAKRREQIVEQIGKAASKTSTQYCGFFGEQRDSPPPTWLREALGEHYFLQVTEVVLIRPGEFGPDAALLSELTHLSKFCVSRGGIEFNDELAKGLAGLNSLDEVSLYYCKLTDAGLSHLSADNPLATLRLRGALITDDGAGKIGRFKELTTLDLSHTLVTDRGMAAVARLPKLRELWLERVMVADKGIEALVQCRSLEILHLADLPLSADVFLAISRMPKLRELHVGRKTLARQEIVKLKQDRNRQMAKRWLGEPNVFWAINRPHAPRNTPYLRWLLERGADPKQKKGHVPAISVLARRGAVEPAIALLEHGADVNQPAYGGATPLCFAARRGQLAMMRMLVQHGAELNPTKTRLPLCSAAYRGQHEAVRLLAAMGADVNMAGYHRTPPIYAALGHPQTLAVLLELGADPDALGPENRTAMAEAVRRGDRRALDVFRQHGFQPPKNN